MTAPSGSTRRTIGILAAAAGGVGVAVQSKINGELGTHLEDGFAAALISFGTGLIPVAAVAVALPSARRGLRLIRQGLRDRSVRPWQCLGGMCGAAIVASQSLTVATLGVAVFTVAIVAGQSLASLAVDRAGLGPAGRQPLTSTRVAGAALSIVAVIIAVADRFATPGTVALALFPAIAGAGSAFQQAVNGRVRAAADSVTVATLINFVAGTSALVVAFAVDVAVRGTPTGSLPVQPWYYAGGVIGVVFIAIAAAVVQYTGVLLLGLAMVAGQLAGALAIDIIAPGSGGRPAVNTLIGIGLTLVAVMIVARPTRMPIAGSAGR